jgi:enoyl-CoA hydratase/carnithine racemase
VAEGTVTSRRAVGIDMRGNVALVTLDNPPLNLLTMQARAELRAFAASARATREIRAVVISGAGERAFCAGSDITEFPADSVGGRARARQEHACYDAIADLPQPVLAALHGHVLGGGLELALACDLRVADADVQVALPEVNLGVFPSGGGTQRLPRIVGAARAKELMFLGAKLDAEEAARVGIVDRVVAPGTALAETMALAEAIARQPARAVQAIKRCVDRGLDHGTTVGRHLEERLIGELFESHDAREGVSAFLEKRAAVFNHR